MNRVGFMMVNPMWFTNSKIRVNQVSKNSLFSLHYPVNPVEERKSIILKLFMQNKPNFPNTPISITPVITKNYITNDFANPPKTNPKRTQSKPIRQMLKMTTTTFITSDYIKKGRFRPKKTNPIQSQSNPIFNSKNLKKTLWKFSIVSINCIFALKQKQLKNNNSKL